MESTEDVKCTHKYQLKQEYLPLLMKLLDPIRKEELQEQMSKEEGLDGEKVTAILTTLEESGLLNYEENAAQSSIYAVAYGTGLNGHRAMLMDHARTDLFRRAIEELVSPGATVIDVGTGSGILGFFAARAGADRVILIDNTAIIEDAKELAQINGLQDKIEFFRGDAAEFAVDVKADLIISEWIGYFLMEEYMYGAFTSVRDRFLAMGGNVIPGAAELYLAPVDAPELDIKYGFGFWEAPMYGFDFSIGVNRQIERLKRVVTDVKQESVLAEPWQIIKLDCQTEHMESFHFYREGEFRIDRAGSVNGFAGWFALRLSPKIVLDTSPFAKSTHWQQTFFPIRAINVQKGDMLRTGMTSENGGVSPNITLQISVVRDDIIIDSCSYTYLGKLF